MIFRYIIKKNIEYKILEYCTISINNNFFPEQISLSDLTLGLSSGHYAKKKFFFEQIFSFSHFKDFNSFHFLEKKILHGSKR